MKDAVQTVSVPPHIGAFLSQITETPDLETALFKVLTEYVDLKIQFLRQRIQTFEAKWKMNFDEFSERGEAKTLGQDPYSYEVESDFWEWEKVETLLKHYGTFSTKLPAQLPLL